MPYAVSHLMGIDIDTPQTSTAGTTPTFPLGTIMPASDGAEYMYVRADATIAIGDFCKIDDDWECTPLTTAISGAEPTSVGAAQVAFVDTDYGWIAVKGTFTGNVASTCAADVALLTTTTSGVIDDAGTDSVVNVKILTTAVAATATACYATSYMCTNSLATEA